MTSPSDSVKISEGFKNQLAKLGESAMCQYKLGGVRDRMPKPPPPDDCVAVITPNDRFQAVQQGLVPQDERGFVRAHGALVEYCGPSKNLEFGMNFGKCAEPSVENNPAGQEHIASLVTNKQHLTMETD